MKARQGAVVSLQSSTAPIDNTSDVKTVFLDKEKIVPGVVVGVVSSVVVGSKVVVSDVVGSKVVVSDVVGSTVDGSNVVVDSVVVNSDDAVTDSEDVVSVETSEETADGVSVPAVVVSTELLVTVLGTSVVSIDPTKSPRVDG